MELGRPKEETAKSPSKEIPGLSPDRLVTSEAKERAKARSSLECREDRPQQAHRAQDKSRDRV